MIRLDESKNDDWFDILPTCTPAFPSTTSAEETLTLKVEPSISLDVTSDRRKWRKYPKQAFAGILAWDYGKRNPEYVCVKQTGF